MNGATRGTIASHAVAAVGMSLPWPLLVLLVWERAGDDVPGHVPVLRQLRAPGNPVPTFGHNAHLAWAMTAGHVDNTDLFLEHVGGPMTGACARVGRGGDARSAKR